MRLKTAVLIICVLVFASLGLKQIANSSQEQEKWEERNSIRAIARRNKAQGKLRVAVPGPIIDYPGMNLTIDDLLQEYSVVVAEQIASKSEMYNSDSIGTWYKFRIHEPISLKVPRYCTTCPEPGQPPGALGSPLSDEFLLAVDGGSLSVDGVTVTQTSERIPAFERHQKYLLFISFLPGGVARLAAGPAAIFRIRDDDNLDGVDLNQHKSYEDIKHRFGGKLSIFKSHIRRPQK